jgi:hypothetical protein
MLRRGLGLSSGLERLIEGGTLDTRLEDTVVLRDVHTSTDALWSFLLFSGYLRAVAVWQQPQDVRLYGTLSIPNREVRTVYQDIFLRWLSDGAGSTERLEKLRQALLSGDAEALQEVLEYILPHQLSSLDPGSALPGPGPRAARTRRGGRRRGGWSAT